MEIRELLGRESKVAVIRTQLEAIRAENEEGILTAESVVVTAAHPDNPLHRLFTWDDSEAAQKYRLVEARTLIRMVRVIPENGTEGRSVQRYVSLMSDRQKDGGGYREVRDVVANDALRAELEETAKKELASWVERHACLTQLTAKVAKAAGLKSKAKK